MSAQESKDAVQEAIKFGNRLGRNFIAQDVKGVAMSLICGYNPDTGEPVEDAEKYLLNKRTPVNDLGVIMDMRFWDESTHMFHGLQHIPNLQNI